MLKRIRFTREEMRLRKEKLKTFWRDPHNKIQNLLSLTPEFFQKQNIKVLVLDFDGVLASHGELQPKPEINDWLKTLMDSKEAPQVCVLSNNPLSERELFFKTHFPKLVWISGVPKKPYPDGLLKVIEKFQVDPKLVCLVDDRILTGVLAAEIAGTQVLLVMQPERSFKKHLMKESFFTLLRRFEQWYVS